MMKMRAAPSKGRKLASRSSSRIGPTRMICLYGRTMATSACSLQIKRFLSSSSFPKGGNVDREMRLQEGHSSHASTPCRLRQLSAFATSSAKAFLPIPSSPVKRSERANRLVSSARRSDSLTSVLPINRENITSQAKGTVIRVKCKKQETRCQLFALSFRFALCCHSAFLAPPKTA